MPAPLLLVAVPKNHNMKKIIMRPEMVSSTLECSMSKAYRILLYIRLAYNKQKHQYVTVVEFCEFTGIDRGLLNF
jgi:hypothetical protein